MKPWYATKEEIPQGLESFYKEEQDGKWVLQVEGMVPEAQLRETKDKLNEFRSNNVSLAQKLKDLEGKKFLSAEEQEEYDTLKKQAQDIEDRDLIDAGKIEELLATRTERMRSDYDNKIEAYKKRAEKAEGTAGTYQKRLANVLVEAEVSKTLSAQGVSPLKGALGDVIARARSTWQVNPDGNLVALNEKGDPVYGNDPAAPLSMHEWTQTVVKEAPYLFMDSKGSGGDGNRSGGDKGGDGIIRISRTDEAAKSKHIEDIASGKAVLVD